MTVPYEVAVSQLQTMFPSVDREVVCAILESHRGHMEKTVEVLLNMSGEIPIEEDTTTNNTSNAVVQKQIEEDAMYAKVLQDRLFLQQLQGNAEFSGLFGDPTSFVPTSPGQSRNTAVVNEPDIVDKVKKLGEAAKLKFKELALKFKKGNSQGFTYGSINGEESEIVSLDTSLIKRTGTSFDEELLLPDEEEPLSLKKPTQTVGLESPSRRGNKKDD